MDPNQTQQPNINQAAPTAVSAPQSGASQPGSLANAQSAPKSGGRMILLAILVFIMFIIVIGIYFFALQYNAPKQTPQPTPAPTITSSPTPTPTPTLDEKDIDSVDIPNPEIELKPIEDDVKQL